MYSWRPLVEWFEHKQKALLVCTQQCSKVGQQRNWRVLLDVAHRERLQKRRQSTRAAPQRFRLDSNGATHFIASGERRLEQRNLRAHFLAHVRKQPAHDAEKVGCFPHVAGHCFAQLVVCQRWRARQRTRGSAILWLSRGQAAKKPLILLLESLSVGTLGTIKFACQTLQVATSRFHRTTVKTN